MIAKQVLPYFKGVDYAAMAPCIHNKLYAAINRQTKSKGYPNQIKVRDFVNYAKQQITLDYHLDKTLM